MRPLEPGEGDGRRPSFIVMCTRSVGKGRELDLFPTPRVVSLEGGSATLIPCDGSYMTMPFELWVSGRLPRALPEVIATRFGDIALVEQKNLTVLRGSVADQAALRALTCLIWDNGGCLVSVLVHDYVADRVAERPTRVEPFRTSG